MLEDYLCVNVRVLQERFSEEFVFKTPHMVVIMTQYERLTTYSGRPVEEICISNSLCRCPVCVYRIHLRI